MYYPQLVLNIISGAIIVSTQREPTPLELKCHAINILNCSVHSFRFKRSEFQIKIGLLGIIAYLLLEEGELHLL